MRREVRLEVVYPHPPEKVWKALTDRKALEKWLLPNDFTPRLGHKFRFLKETPGSRKRKEVQCEVVELEAPHRLAYTWRNAPDDPPELVCWTLEPVEAGTCLRLEHLSLEEAPAPLTASLDPQWTQRLDSQLSAYLKDEVMRCAGDKVIWSRGMGMMMRQCSQVSLRRMGRVRFFPAHKNASVSPHINIRTPHHPLTSSPHHSSLSESEKTHA